MATKADLKEGEPKVTVAFMELQQVLLALQLAAVPLAEPYLEVGLLRHLIQVEVPPYLKEEVDRVLPSLVEDHPFPEVDPCWDQLLAVEAGLYPFLAAVPFLVAVPCLEAGPYLVEVPYQAELPCLVAVPYLVEDHPYSVAVPCQDVVPFLVAVPFLNLEVVPLVILEEAPCLVVGPCREAVQSSCLEEAQSSCQVVAPSCR